MNDETIRYHLKDLPTDRVKDFMKYHNDNPQAWELFEEKAFEMYQMQERFGARAIFEIIRYLEGKKKGPDGFKINNNYTPIYPRLLVSMYPHLEDFFKFREIKDTTKKAVMVEEQIHIINDPVPVEKRQATLFNLPVERSY